MIHRKILEENAPNFNSGCLWVAGDSSIFFSYLPKLYPSSAMFSITFIIKHFKIYYNIC